MQPAKQRDAQGIVQDAADERYFPIPLKRVAVRDVDALILVYEVASEAGKFRAYLIGQVRAEPDVVVAGQIDHARAALDEVVEFKNYARAMRGNDGSIFKPKIKEVAHDVQALGVFADGAQKVDERVFPNARWAVEFGRAYVRVRDEVDFVFRHVAMIRHEKHERGTTATDGSKGSDACRAMPLCSPKDTRGEKATALFLKWSVGSVDI